jgi:hypothetical protein
MLAGERIQSKRFNAYLFCSACGDNIAAHFQSETATKSIPVGLGDTLRSQ